MNDVIECFNKLAENAARYRKIYTDAGLKFDGKAYWEQLKPILNTIGASVEIDTDNIKRLYKELTDKDAPETDNKIAEDIELAEYDLNGEMEEQNHFFIQLFRIPLYGAKTFTKLMQIALNIGQLTPYIDSFPAEYTLFYKNNRLNMIDTYLKNIRFHADDHDKIKQFMSHLATLDAEIMAKFDRDAQNKITESGSYYGKYMKYKAKYMRLTKN